MWAGERGSGHRGADGDGVRHMRMVCMDVQVGTGAAGKHREARSLSSGGAGGSNFKDETGGDAEGKSEAD